MAGKQGNAMLDRVRGKEGGKGGLKTPQDKNIIKTATQDASVWGPYNSQTKKVSAKTGFSE